MALDPVRFGVIGCADFARVRMLPAMAASPDIDITAIASRSASKAAEFTERHGGRPVTGYAELLADKAIEAVYVPLPAALHAEWVRAALDAGKHVLAEKPLSTDPVRTRELLELAGRRGLVLRENVMFVHHQQHAVVRKLLADGAIGELRALHAVFGIPSLSDGNIRYDPELGGGALWDVGIYPVRAAVHFLGSELDVVGACLTTSPGKRVDTSGAALLQRRSDGVTAQLTFGFEHTYRSAYELWGEEGRITVERAFTPPADHSPVIDVERTSGSKTLRLEPDDQVGNTLHAFVAAVRSGVDEWTDDTMTQAELLETVRRSGRRIV